MARYLLLLLIPVALVLDRRGASPPLVFLASALGIVPLTALVGRATENLAVRLGPTLGGLLNATTANVPELIIGLFALRRGLVTVVKASISGSVLGNVLFGLGLSLLAGGARRRILRFNPLLAGLHAKLLILAAIGLMVPALFHFASGSGRRISLEIATVLLVAYVASLVFMLVTHRQLSQREQAEGPLETGRAAWGAGRALAVLAASTAALAVTSETLTRAVEPTAGRLGLNPVFAGVFLLALVGNVSELFNAVHFARQDRMDLALSVTLGAATQVALLVAPVLVFAGALMGRPMELMFSRFEVVAIAVAVFVGRSVTVDGESNWLEGVMLLAVYAMLGVGFYYLQTD